MMLLFQILLGAVLGASVGSFLGCAFYRIPARVPLTGRSFCPSCGEMLPATRNIPVVSWLMLAGRSACCNKPLSVHYLLFELAAAMTGALIAVALGMVWMLVAAVAVVMIASSVSLVSLRSQQ